MVKKRGTGGASRYRESYKKLKVAAARASQPQDKKQAPTGSAPRDRDARRRKSFLAKVASSAAAALRAKPAISKRKCKAGFGGAGGAPGKRARRRGGNPLARIADLSSALDGVDETLREATRVKAARAAERERLGPRTMRSTRRMVAAESKRMRAILADGAFKADPFGEVARMLGESLGPPPRREGADMAVDPFRKAGT